MKQTAVEYYRENILKITRLLVTGEITTDSWVILETDATNISKEMEEQQKIEFANWCRIHDNKYPNEVWTIQQLFDKYYNETYGGNE